MLRRVRGMTGTLYGRYRPLRDVVLIASSYQLAHMDEKMREQHGTVVILLQG